MKKLSHMTMICSTALLMFLMLSYLPVSSQTINVTMRLNTSTNLDTLMEHHIVQIRGEATGTVYPAVAWNADTGITLNNIGGDLWETTFQASPGTVLKYKFWTGFTLLDNTFFWNGWEGPINPANPLDSGDNRLFIAGDKDTTLALQYYHCIPTNRDQYWRPFATKPDSFALYFRVNMAALMETGEFDADVDPVVVRYGTPLDPTDAWETDIVLTREEGSIDENSFFSGVKYVANTSLTPGAVQNYKFVYKKGTSLVWEKTSNRNFTFTAAKDTTIHWTYFNNQRPSGGKIVNATLTWQVNTEGLEKLGLFDRSLGDRIVIDGAKAWSVASAIEMNYVPLLGLWVGQESFIKAPGAILEYKTVLLWDASRVDPASSNYLSGLDLTVPLQYWEGPSVTGTGNRNYTYTSQTDQMIPGDLGFDHQFFNGLPPEGVIETPIKVTFNIDMNPAADIGTNPANPLFRPGIDSVWVQFTDCLLPLTQLDGIYTNTPLLLEDLDGDVVYSGSIDLVPPFPYDVAYRVNYSTDTGTNIQNGGGNNKGRSYYQFVHPLKINAEGVITWPTEFAFPVLPWKDSDLDVEDPPDLWTAMAVQSSDDVLSIKSFALRQNYPNPFNPRTTIQYQVAEKSLVQVAVYNLAGQRVATLVNSQQPSGDYTITWNGTDGVGNQMPSGIYFAKMTAGSFAQTKKMMLIR